MKRSPIRSKSPARKLKRQIDLLVKAYVHARDGHQCVRCGKGSGLQAAHIRPKGKFQRMRFDPLNILSLCMGCHKYFNHLDPVGFTEWLQEKYPGRLDQLKVCAAVARKVDLQELLIYWTEQSEKDFGLNES